MEHKSAFWKTFIRSLFYIVLYGKMLLSLEIRETFHQQGTSYIHFRPSGRWKQILVCSTGLFLAPVPSGSVVINTVGVGGSLEHVSVFSALLREPETFWHEGSGLTGALSLQPTAQHWVIPACSTNTKNRLCLCGLCVSAPPLRHLTYLTRDTKVVCNEQEIWDKGRAMEHRRRDEATQ